MGLLDWVDPTRKKFAGLLQGTPLGQMLKGEKASGEGLLGALKSMPVFSPDAGQSAYDAALNIGPMGLGKIVYHGSPHKFDKFDASKIGTGEGAQAYGHGIYMADSPDVAGQYTKFTLQHHIDAELAKPKPDMEWVARAKAKEAELFKNAPADAGLYKADLPDEWIPKMLDWDKPLAEQSKEVQKALSGVGVGAGPKSVEEARAGVGASLDRLRAIEREVGDRHPIYNKAFDDLTAARKHLAKVEIFSNEPASAIYSNLGHSKEDSSAILRRAGITGIRYLDGGSRGAASVNDLRGTVSMWEGAVKKTPKDPYALSQLEAAKKALEQAQGGLTYNYVVFPGLEDKVKILERNGQPLGGLLGR